MAVDSSPTAILDPSLLVKSDIRKTSNMIKFLDQSFALYLPRTFIRSVEYYSKRETDRKPELFDYFDSYDQFQRPERLISELEEFVLPFCDIYSVPQPQSGTLYPDEYDYLRVKTTDGYRGGYQSPYHEKGSRLTDTIYEMMVFSLEMSPIFSRIKKPLNLIGKAIGTKVELADRNIERAWNEIAREAELDGNMYSIHERIKRQPLEDRIELLKEAVQSRYQDTVTKILLYRAVVKQWTPSYIAYAAAAGAPGDVTKISSGFPESVVDIALGAGILWVADP